MRKRARYRENADCFHRRVIAWDNAELKGNKQLIYLACLKHGSAPACTLHQSVASDEFNGPVERIYKSED